MTTLAIMKARIASELRRSNITTQIASAISTAIQAYEHERFYTNESRENTFSTVLDQEFYSSSDASFIGLLTKIDYVFLFIQDTPFELFPVLPRVIEDASTNATATGTPTEYAWYDEKIRLYPVPADAWTVRVGGVLSISEPASDSETGNFWMTTAERLIRSRAKQELALHVLRDIELAQIAGGAASEAFTQLNIRTNRITKTGGGRIKPMNY
jgi:hypothetical protein